MTSRDAMKWMLLPALWVLAGCPAHTDWTGTQRLTDYTAYTLNPGEFRMGAGVVGTGYDDLGAIVRVEYAPVRHLEFDTNLAHDALGVVNLFCRYGFLDAGDWALTGSAGLRWFNPHNLWILPEKSRDELSDVNVFMVPVTVTGSWAAASWLGVHLRLGYTFSGVDGALSQDDALAKGGFGGHEVFVQPALTFYPFRGTAFILGAQLPVYSGVYVSAVAETPVSPGVVAGVESDEFQRLDVKGLSTVYVAAQMNWGAFNLRVTLTRGLRFFDKQVSTVLPGLEAFWRF